MKMCSRMSVISQEHRKNWLERQNMMIKYKPVTLEPSLLESSLFPNDIGVNLVSDLHGKSSGINSGRRTKVSSNLILYENVHPELSAEDRKILRLMALRREEAIREEEMAQSIRTMWTEEKKRYTKAMEEKKKYLNEYIAQKRKIENMENSWRKKIQTDISEEEKILLETRINEKNERIERRKKEISAQKKLKCDSVTPVKEELRRQLKKNQEMEENVKSKLKMKYCMDKCKRAEEKLKLILDEKSKRIKEESLKRDMKWQAAKSLRDEIRRKTEEIQRENLKRKKACQEMKEAKVTGTAEWKKKTAMENNQIKKEYHSLIYNKLKEEEKQKEAQARMLLHMKEAKMRDLREKREMAISKSRHNSRMASKLRQKIKSSYNL